MSTDGQLRAEAEVKIGQLSPEADARAASELLHDLQVHQIELEMQNEDLRQTRLALEESRDRYRHLYDFAPIAYLTLSDEGLIREINHAGAALFGVARRQLLNCRIVRYVAPEDRGHWQLCLPDLLHNNACCEIRLQREDGSRFYGRFECWFNAEGNAKSAHVTLTDFTESRQMGIEIEKSRESLNAQRQLLQSILDNAPIGIWMLGVDNRMKFVNKTFCQAVGIPEQQFLNASHYSEILPPSVSANCMKSDHECFEQEKRHISEERLLFVDGKEHLLEITKAKLSDPAGCTIGLIGLGIDITERRQAEIRLNESAAKYRAIFESTLDGIVLIDETGKIVDFNPEFVRQTGKTPSQLRQTWLWELRPPEKTELAKAVFHEAMQTGSGGKAAFKYKKPDGVVIHVEVRGTVILIGGRRYLQCIVQDTTERLWKEAELKEHQRMLRGLAAQGTASREAELKHFAREVHDELGQLLTALRMDISLLRIQFGERDPVLMANIQDMLVLVDKAIQGARDVTANLHPHALDMGVVPAIKWLSDEFASRMGIDCRFQVVDHLAGLDEVRTLTLFRIVQESLTNIARYAGASRVDITLRKQDEYVCVEVKDDGKGFDVNAMRAEKSFGLLGMKERAIAVCGKVEIISAPGQGTLVKVTIPLFQINPGRRAND